MDNQDKEPAVIEESGLKFSFSDETIAIKFDDRGFYRNFFNKLPGGKGVDIVADSSDYFQFIEIKNCTGHERENLWRTSVNNGMISQAPEANSNGEYRESLDFEIAKKVASTISCFYGAWSKEMHTETSAELAPFWKKLNETKIKKDEKQIRVILFLEGNFDAVGSRSKKMIMQRLESSIQGKLSWLNCKVSVVDSTTCTDRFFRVSK